MSSTSDLKGKTCILTGGGSGIGLCFTEALLKKGCNVLIGDMKLTDDAQKLVDSTKGKTPKAVFQETDVTSWPALTAMFEAAIKEFGAVDIVCPNAGVFEPPFSSFWHPPGSEGAKDQPDSGRYTTVDINVTHPIRLTQMAVGYFQYEKRPGTVLLVSSIAAQMPTPSRPIYAASKAFISNFTRSLGVLDIPPQDAGVQRIKVLAVAPGMVLTPLWTSQSEEEIKGFENVDVEWVSVEEVANAMVDFCTNDEWKGGEVMEVSHKGVRRVKNTMDEGPSIMGEKYEKMSDEEKGKMNADMVKPAFEGAKKMAGKRVF